jgi:hypothetical protein
VLAAFKDAANVLIPDPPPLTEPGTEEHWFDAFDAADWHAAELSVVGVLEGEVEFGFPDELLSPVLLFPFPGFFVTPPLAPVFESVPSRPTTSVFPPPPVSLILLAFEPLWAPVKPLT